MSLKDIFLNVIDGQVLEVEVGIQAALTQGIPAEDILNQALIAGMDEVGRCYEVGEFFVPEMLIAARAMQAGMHLLKPHLTAGKVKSAGTVAIGTVQGDIHDIGKNLVVMMLEGSGFEVHDLGVDVSPAAFVQAAQDGAQVLAMSALLTTSMDCMQAVLQVLQSAGQRSRVKVLIGGAPVTQSFADQIGADGFAPDASSAVRVVRQLLAQHG